MHDYLKHLGLSLVVPAERYLQQPCRSNFSQSNIGCMCWCGITGSASSLLQHSSLVPSLTLRFTLVWSCITASGLKDTSDPRKEVNTLWSDPTVLGSNWPAAETSGDRTVCKLYTRHWNCRVCLLEHLFRVSLKHDRSTTGCCSWLITWCTVYRWLRTLGMKDGSQWWPDDEPATGSFTCVYCKNDKVKSSLSGQYMEDICLVVEIFLCSSTSPRHYYKHKIWPVQSAGNFLFMGPVAVTHHRPIIFWSYCLFHACCISQILISCSM